MDGGSPGQSDDTESVRYRTLSPWQNSVVRGVHL